MDCKTVIKQINELNFDPGFTPDQELWAHLERCADCRQYYEAHQESAHLVSLLRNQEPVMDHPEELKASILANISQPVRPQQPMLFVIRLLAAASLALLLTLGVEQYTVLRKVQHIEVQLGKVEPVSSAQQRQLYRSSLVDLDVLLSEKNNQGLKKALLLLRLKRFGNPDLTYKEIQRTIHKDPGFLKLWNEQKLKP